MCSDVETHIVHKHTNTTHTGPVHSTSWTMGAGLTAKSLWYPHYEESQPGHETWMTLFPKTRTHEHRRTQKYKYLGNECTTVSIKQPAHPHYELTGDKCMWPFPAGMWPLVWGRTMMGMSVLIRQKCCFPGWTGITVSHTGMCESFPTSNHPINDKMLWRSMSLKFDLQSNANYFYAILPVLSNNNMSL